MWPFSKSLADRVKEALDGETRLRALNLQVSENRGNVVVSGFAPHANYADLVRAVVGGIHGVKNVDTSGILSAQQGMAQNVAEIPVAEQEVVQQSSQLAKAVLAAIRGNGELADDPIDVLQSGGSVILRGVVDNDHELRLLEQVARGAGAAGVDVSGVRVAAGVKELVKDSDPETGDTVYVVKAGDTLGAIAQRYYGDAQEYKKIAHYNNIANPDHIEVGQRIRIPH